MPRSRNRNQKEPLHHHEVPTRPWSKLAADIFQFENELYLLIVDYYSEFFEISKLSDMKSSTVITHCKSQFSRHGIPDIFMSDCAKQFDSAEMRKFAVDYGFQLKTIASSPTCAQSNGMAEKTTTREPTRDTPQPAQPLQVQPQPKMTSSGRVVKPPAYLKDYVTK